jgi:hypothetical protein
MYLKLPMGFFVPYTFKLRCSILFLTKNYICADKFGSYSLVAFVFLSLMFLYLRVIADKTMRRYSPPYRSPPRRGYGGRGRSPPRRGYGGRKEQGSGSLLVRNIPLSCRAEDLRVPFERFGPVRDVYLPKDYYTG